MAAADLSVVGTGLSESGPASANRKRRVKGLAGSRLPMVDAETALGILEEKLSSRYKSVKDAFVNMDYNLDGKISAGEFRVTLDLMGLVMPDSEFSKLWRHFDPDGDGALSYAKFNNKVGAMLHPPITRHVIDRPQTPRVRAQNAKKLAIGLKKRMANLKDAFRMIDSDGSGRISHAEFIQALRHVGLNKISHDASYDLMMMFKDKDDQTPELSFAEFVKTMESYLKVEEAEKAATETGAFHEVPEMSLNHAEKLLSEKLWGKFKAVQRAFRAFDLDKSGTLSYDEFRSALIALGVNLSDPDFKELVQKYDSNGDGVIGYDEFNAQVGHLIHPNSYNTSVLNEKMMQTAGAQEGALHFNPGAHLGRQATAARKMTLSERAALVAPTIGLLQGEAMFVQQVCGQYKSLAKAFRSADHDSSGTLSQAEFHAMLESLGVHLDHDDFEELMYKYDVNGDGKVSYDELLARLGFLLQGSDTARKALGLHMPVETPRAPAAQAESKRSELDWDAASFDDVASVGSVSTSAIDVRGVEARMKKVLGRSWIHVYKDLQRKQGADGTIESERFRDAMAKQGVALTSKEVRALQRAHDSSSSGGPVSYDRIMQATFRRG